jgi:superfamily II DNA/RNA helicase
LKFSEFDFEESLLAGLRDLRFEEPTPIQEQSIPIVLGGKDLIGVAQTGTGKTGAFVIPIMQRVLKSERKGVKALILSPTRELATQIDEQIFAIGYHAGITSATVIGGSDFSIQAKALKAGVDIIVATPGRLIDQNKVVSIDFSNLEYFVLDEADRMLDMGFLPDMKKIISWIPEKRQTLLFSATMPGEIKKLASSIMTNPDMIEIERSKPTASVEQRSYSLLSHQKIPLVKGIFDQLTWDSCIIFTSTKKGTDELQRLLKKEGIKAASIHGDRSQDERNRALNAFKNGKVPVIVATDVLARGIDIKGVSIIINYDVPNNSDDYVHRIGRTGRYDKSGIAITFVTRRDSKTFRSITNIKGNKIKQIDVPQEFSSVKEFSWEEGFKKETSGKGGSEKKKEDSGKKEGGKSASSSRQNSSDDKQKRTPEKKDHKSDPQQEQDRSKRPSRKGGNGRVKKSEPETKSASESKPKVAEERPSKEVQEKEQEPKEKIVLPPVVEKAVERNKRARKPSKGVWGILKSFFPKLK